MHGGVLKHRSGRVIALGRALLGAIFLVGIWADQSQPAIAPAETYALLFAYVAISAAVGFLTWNDWWLDAKLAAPAHLVDIAMFALLIFGTEGYTSPFFLFFVFLVLSAGIRWGWRATAATAVSLIALYLAAGLIAAAADGAFELDRFIIRGGHLIVLSGILVWFGVDKGFEAVGVRPDEKLPAAAIADSPIEVALEWAVRLSQARSGTLVWQSANGEPQKGGLQSGCGVTIESTDRAGFPAWDKSPFIFDLVANRALAHGRDRRAQFFPARDVLGARIMTEIGEVQGLALTLKSETGQGLLVLGGIESLSTDYIEWGQQIGASIAAFFDQHALLSAVELAAVSSARLGLSRDLHDSIVQFLAGATFRIEAISRASNSGAPVAADLRELKQLMLEEQQSLRNAIGAIRTDEVPLPRLAADLKGLCERLARQWNIGCSFSAEVPDNHAPMRIHLDAHQLIREAVANAVRHGGARDVRVAVSAEDSLLLLEVVNDCAAGDQPVDCLPWSLRERVSEAHGTLMLASQEGKTTVSVTLPLSGQGVR